MKIRHIFFIVWMVCLHQSAVGQIKVNKPVRLNGQSPADHQIENVAAPVSPTNILSAEEIQKNAGRYGLATGIDSLSILIPNGIQSYVPGSIIYFKAAAVNKKQVRVSINNLPFLPLMVFGSDTLKANQLIPGQIYCIIFSGNSFQMLSNLSANCRTSFVEANNNTCIEIEERAPVQLFDAMRICGENNARLCRWGEWFYACQKAGLGVKNMADNWEWADDAANSGVHISGKGNCRVTSSSDPLEIRAYRCCYSK